MVLTALCCAVPPEMVSMITQKEAFDAISEMCVGDDHMKMAAQNLQQQLDLAAFKEGESIKDFVLHLKGMVTTLATLGKKLEETMINKVIHLNWIMVAITTLLGVSTLTIEGLIDRLKVVKDANEKPSMSLHQDGRLYLTEEEWDAQ